MNLIFFQKKRNLVLLSLLVSIVISVSCYFYYSYEEKNIRIEKQNELEAIARLKTRQISEWYSDHLYDAQIIISNNFLTNQLLNAVEKKSLQGISSLKSDLLTIIDEHDLRNILVVAPQNELIFSVNPAGKELDDILKKNLEHSISSKNIVATDLYLSEIDKKIYFDVISPLADSKNNIKAAVVFQIDPEDFLFPYLESWPLISKSSETLIVRKEENSVLFLNELKHKKNTALKLSLSLTEKHVPAVMAWYGKTGIVEGIDYTGNPVLADIVPISGTPWTLIAKVNKSEMNADLWYRGSLILILSAVSILLFVLGVSFLYNFRKTKVYEDLLNKEKELRENIELFKTTLYSIDDGVVITDTNCKIKNMNVVAEELTGWKERESAAQNLGKVVNLVEENSHKELNSSLKEFLEKGIVPDIKENIVLTSKNGEYIPVELNIAFIKDEFSKNIGIVVILRDQTVERKASKSLEQSEEYYKTLFNQAHDPIIVFNPENEVVLDVNSMALKVYGFSREEFIGMSLEKISLNIPSGKEKIDKVISEGSYFGFETRQIRKDGKEIIVEVNATKINYMGNEAILSVNKDVTERKKEEELIKINEERILLAMRAGNQGLFDINTVTGIAITNEIYDLSLGYKPGELKETFSKWLKRIHREDRVKVFDGFRKFFSKQQYENSIETRQKTKSGEWKWFFTIGKVIEYDENGRPLRIIGLQTDITERKNAEESLRESEELFRRSFEISPDAININRLEDGLFVNVNEGFLNITGYTKEDLDGKTSREINIWADIEDREKMVAAIKRDGYVTNLEAKYRMKDGRILTGLMSAAILNIHGVPHILSITRNFEEIKKVQNALIESEERFKALLENSNDIILILDEKGNFKYLSPMFEDITGFKIEDKIGKSAFEGIHPDDLEEVVYEFSKGLQKDNKRSPEIQYRYKIKDGSYIYIETIGFSLISNPYINGILINARNITERKEAEKTLRLYEHTIRNISESVTVTDLDNNIIYVNSAFEKTYGYSFEEVYKKNISIVTKHSDDITQNVLNETISGGWHGELLNVKKDGTVFPVSLSTSRIYDDENNLIGLVGVANDITHRKEAEKNLKLYEHTIRNIAESVTITDTDNNIIYVNKAFEKIYGYTFNEVYQKHISVITHYDHSIINKILSATKDSGWRGELLNIKKNGIVFPIDLTTSKIYDENNNIIGLVGVAADITERKTAERQLKESEERFKGLFENATLGIYRGKPDGQLLFCNNALLNILGYKNIEELKKVKAAELYVDSRERDLFIQEMEKNDFVSGFEEKFYKSDGTVITVSESARAAKDEKGNLLFYEGIIEDITEKIENINLIKIQSNLLLKLQTSNNLDEILDETINTFIAINPFDSCGIYLMEGDDLVLKKHYGVSKEFIEQVGIIKPDSSHFNLMNLKNPIFTNITKIELPSDDPGFAEGIKEIAIIPLYYENNLTGCINLAVHKVNNISESAKNAVVSIASILSEVLAKMRTYQILAESEERFRNIVQNSEAIFFSINKNGIFTLSEGSALKSIGLKPGEVVGHSFDVIYGEFPKVIDDINSAFEGNSIHTILNMGKVDFEMFYNPKYDEKGNVEGVIGLGFDITERLKQEENIEKLSRAVEQSQVLILITDIHGKIEYVNPKFEAVTGYSFKEVYQQNPRILKSGLTTEKEYKKMWTKISRGEDWQGIFHNKKKNGELYWESAHISPIKKDGNVTHYVAVKEDITEKVKAQEELNQYKQELEKLVEKRTIQLKDTNKKLALEIEKQKEYDKQLQDQLYMLSTFLDSMPTAAFIKDADLKFIEVNHAFEELVGLNKNEIIGKNSNEIFDKDFADELDKQDAAILKTKKLETFNYRFIDSNKHERFLLINKVIYQKAYGELGGILGTYIDISDQKKLQESIERSLAKEKELNELKTRFISMASHEFRTPLTSISIFSDLIEMQKDKNDPETVSEHISKIQKSVSYMTELINDVLTVSRAETGKLKFTPENVALKSFCDDLITEMKLNITEKHKIILNYNIDKKLIYADAKLLRYIISNLLTNAVKYSPNGGEIILTIEEYEKKLKFSVSDQGIGMSESVMKNLFEPFLRGDNIGSIPGTGLGLSIIKKAVDMHNGNITCASKLEEGTTFTVTIPMLKD